MRAGYAEVVKYGLIDKPDFYDWLESGRWRGIFCGATEREEAVRLSCAAKADSSRATRPRRAIARSSISVTPSAMRLRR